MIYCCFGERGGELKVVAYKNGKKWAENVVKTMNSLNKNEAKKLPLQPVLFRLLSGCLVPIFRQRYRLGYYIRPRQAIL